MGNTDPKETPSPDTHFKNRQGLWLRTFKQIPSGPAKGLIYFLHGYGEHLERPAYIALFQQWTGNGLIVCAHEHQGFGKSEGERGHVEKMSDYVQDFSDLLSKVTADHPDLPVFILGHSMGAAITLDWGVHDIYPKPPKFYVIFNGLATLLDPSVLTPFNSFLISSLAGVLPQAPVEALDSSTMSRNKEACASYDKDPLVVMSLKAHWTKTFVTHVQGLSTMLSKVSFPFLATHGSADKVADAQSSRELFNQATSQDKKLIIFDDWFHEPFEDPEKEKWEQAILTWINERC